MSADSTQVLREFAEYGGRVPGLIEGDEETGQKNSALSAGAESLVSEENMARYRKEIDGVFDGSLPSGRTVLVGDTPSLLMKYGARSLPLTMTQNDIMKIAYPENYFGGKHNLGISAVKNIPYQVADPLAIVKSNTQKDSLVLLTDWVDEHNDGVIVPIHLDKRGVLSPENRIASAYGRDLKAILGPNNSNILYTRNNENIDQLLSSRLQLPSARADDTLIARSIPQSNPDVNTEVQDDGLGAANAGFAQSDYNDWVENAKGFHPEGEDAARNASLPTRNIDGAKTIVAAVKKLSADVGIPADLKGILREEDIDFLAESAYADACRPGNPRETSVEEIKELYRSLL